MKSKIEKDDKNIETILVNESNSFYEIDMECMRKKSNQEKKNIKPKGNR